MTFENSPSQFSPSPPTRKKIRIIMCYQLCNITTSALGEQLDPCHVTIKGRARLMKDNILINFLNVAPSVLTTVKASLGEIFSRALLARLGLEERGSECTEIL
jgi:hypothetical protein